MLIPLVLVNGPLFGSLTPRHGIRSNGYVGSIRARIWHVNWFDEPYSPQGVIGSG